VWEHWKCKQKTSAYTVQITDARLNSHEKTNAEHATTFTPSETVRNYFPQGNSAIGIFWNQATGQKIVPGLRRRRRVFKRICMTSIAYSSFFPVICFELKRDKSKWKSFASLYKTSPSGAVIHPADDTLPSIPSLNGGKYPLGSAGSR
jgi:hypothetical protein